MIKVNLLRDAIRRHRVGLIKLDQLIRIFRSVEERMTLYTKNFQNYRTRLRKYEGDRLKQYQNKIFQVNQAIEKGAFQEVIQLVAQGRAIRQEVMEGLEAITRFDLAKELLTILKTEIGSIWLNQMPTILVLERALVEADKLMLKGEYQQAKILINFCSIKAQERSHKTPKSKGKDLIERIEYLKTICSDTSAYKSHLTNETVEITGKIEVVLHTLIEEGQLLLVAKLVDDLGYLFEDRRSFRDRIMTHSEIAKNHHDQLIASLQSDSWLAGANYIFSKRIEAFLINLKEVDKKLDSVQSQ